ncbi:MAG: metallophosphoesterase [Nitrosopumilus sp.]|nr:metallophosphoesterase [Nitrosopumilus sp.]MDH3489191.1 metallophosphoesterase [Nitrosopumilus sp.]MDH3516190.1 metallophosphoesterase [Nitrosopumilus sp.]MDH3565465.1 metallophosphoesterase [Nitrosopumilus sp.]MDH5416954.1 metallophosphoesterase [Nitrosopumilus sp.]
MNSTKKRKVLAMFGLFVAVLSVNMILVEPAIIETDTVEIEGTGINMTIAFLSDFQRRDADPTFVQRAVDMVNSKNPDLILLGGDYVENSIDELPSIEPLKDLKSKYGVYGVMGNHDYLAFGFARNVGGDAVLAQQILQFFETPNPINDSQNDRIKILRNEKVVISDKVTLIGLDDLWANLRDESKAYADKSTGYKILLSHNQEELDIKKETADLYLFGHTHCGQMRLPVLGSIPKIFGFSGEYDKGYYVLDDGAHVYTTCGLAPAPRLLNPPEISIINLVP